MTILGDGESYVFEGKALDMWDATVGTMYTLEMNTPGYPLYISRSSFYEFAYVAFVLSLLARLVADALGPEDGVTNNGEDVGEITFQPTMAFVRGGESVWTNADSLGRPGYLFCLWY